MKYVELWEVVRACTRILGEMHRLTFPEGIERSVALACVGMRDRQAIADKIQSLLEPHLDQHMAGGSLG